MPVVVLLDAARTISSPRPTWSCQSLTLRSFLFQQCKSLHRIQPRTNSNSCRDPFAFNPPSTLFFFQKLQLLSHQASRWFLLTSCEIGFCVVLAFSRHRTTDLTLGWCCVWLVGQISQWGDSKVDYIVVHRNNWLLHKNNQKIINLRNPPTLMQIVVKWCLIKGGDFHLWWMFLW